MFNIILGQDCPSITQYLRFEVPVPLIGWLSNLNYSLLSLVILTSWATIGYDMVIFLAALQGIPRTCLKLRRSTGLSLPIFSRSPCR